MTQGFADAAVLTGIVILVAFLASATGEYTHGTIRTMLTRGPGRLPMTVPTATRR